jgi:amidase
MDAVWAVRLSPSSGSGPRLAVKDCIDVAGLPTVVGSRALASASPAVADAPVVASARAAGARLVGKTQLVELCRHADGVNHWAGTPANPLDPSRLPGGSSSGSAVAIALGEADVAYGTDTGGSVRVPAACCGIVGLKTTAGRVPTHGVFEFSRTLDTVGPMGRTVADVALGMALMEPGFAVSPVNGPLTCARLRLPGVDAGIDAAVDRALAEAGFACTDVSLPAWRTWNLAADELMAYEGYLAMASFLERPELLEERHVASIEYGTKVSASRAVECRRLAVEARGAIDALLAEHTLIALPTLAVEPPLVAERAGLTYLTVALNFTGHPALALPVPREDSHLPASLQLVGPHFSEETLLGYGATPALTSPV